MRANLLSTEKLRSKGLFYRNDKQVISTKNGIVANFYSYENVPHIQIANSKVHDNRALAMNSHTLGDSAATVNIWHARFGHMPEDRLKQAIKVSRGMKVIGSYGTSNCHSCMEATSKRIISRVKTPRPTEPLTPWNVDVVTVKPESIGKARYFALMTDAASITHRVVFHTAKNGAYIHLEKLVKYVKNNTGKLVKVIHVDGGREYGGIELTELCANNVIDLHVTTPHNSEQNGHAEVSNHYICTVARILMIHGKIPKGLWTEAVDATVYIINLTP